MRRRRGGELDAAIRSAVLELLADHGPAGVTMEAVAAAARTSKPVLYRRWPDRGALLRDTLLQIATAAIPHEDTGSYRSDMLAILRGWAALFTGPQAPALRAAIGATAHDPELRAAFQHDVIAWRKKEMAALLARGIERGDVRPDVPVEIARELGQERAVAPTVDHRRSDHRRPRRAACRRRPGAVRRPATLALLQPVVITELPSTSWPSDESFCDWSTCCPCPACGFSARSPRPSS